MDKPDFAVIAFDQAGCLYAFDAARDFLGDVEDNDVHDDEYRIYSREGDRYRLGFRPDGGYQLIVDGRNTEEELQERLYQALKDAAAPETIAGDLDGLWVLAQQRKRA